MSIKVPDDARPLRISPGFAEDQTIFEAGLDELNRGLVKGATPSKVGRRLRRIKGARAVDADAMAETFAQLQSCLDVGNTGVRR